MHITQNERLVLFIDGPNLYAAVKALGFDIDYKKLLALFRAKGRLIRALYYTTIFEEQEFVSIRPLVDWLEYNGYTMVTKPAREFTDSEGRRRVRSSMSVELAVDALQLMPRVDHYILFTGDGDFRSLVAALQRQGKRVSVVSTLATHTPMVADDLRRQADQFIDLEDLEPLIGRAPATRREPVESHSEPMEQHQVPAPVEPSERDATVADAAPARVEALAYLATPGEAPKPVVVTRRARPRPPAK